ncbi:MAG: aldo/keto reductase [Deltaproteobacteria bacterium]|nr:aldo/keto reductase [Deltaproteobacteria bacterium]
MAGPNRGKRIFAVDYIGRVMEESLRRLQTDYIDLYQLHNPDVEVIRHGEVWELLERRKKEGKIRHYGVSINKMDEGIAAVQDGRSDTIQIEYNLLDQEPAQEVFPLAQKANVGVIVRVPLRRGLLTGKFTLEDQQRFQGEDVRARNFAGEIFQKELEKVERLRFLERPHRSLAQAAIAFCIAHPAVSVVIPGGRNGHQVRENVAAGDLKLSSEELQRIGELWRNGFRT